MKYSWVTDDARTFYKNGHYTLGDETVEQRYSDIADRLEAISNIKGFADKWREYFRKGWTTLSSPIIANLGRDTGLPASCNFLKLEDTLESIASGEYEMTLLAKNGAGTARNFSNIRPKGQPYGVGGESVGVINWIRHYANKIRDVSQGGMRRGFLTAYLSVDHPEIMDFLQIGREGNDIKRITTGVTIPEGWMESLLAGDKDKWEIWVELHEARAEIGRPYILFEDNCNKGKHQVYIDKGFWLDSSNICTECVEWSDEEKEFLCVLLSVNLEHYDEWKDTDFIFDCNIALDCVVTEYINKAKHIKGHEKAVKFAEEHRSIGIGVMGLHTYFKKNSIAIGSLDSHRLNYQIFKKLREESDRASKWMAKEWGEPKMLAGYGDRNTSRIALAPTKSTANLADVSEGTQTDDFIYGTKDLAKIQREWKDKYFEAVLEKYNKNTQEIWDSILENGGSVQHLDFLTDHEKDVFKISTEISQLDIIKLASSRVKFIDQSQSINLVVPATADAFEVMSLTVEAWKGGLKTLYYQHNVNMAREATKSLLTCSACEA